MAKARKKPNLDEIATYQNDITQYYIGKVLTNPDTVLSTEAAGQGLKIYAELERDDRVYSEMQKRKLAVIGKEWSIEPASEDAQDVKIAEFVEQNFKELKFDRACEELLDGILMGFKPCEIMWDYSEGDIWIKEYLGRDPRRFTFGLENQLRLLTRTNMLEGEEVPNRKFQLFRFGEKNNNPFGMGLGNKIYWPVWFKKNGVKFWAVFLEKFGQPTPWGKYPPGTEKSKQDDLLDALKAMQTDQCIITPDTMMVELLEAARTSSVDSYEKWGNFWNTAITLVILGQTATTEGTPGKLGAETARSDVRQEYVKADSDRLSEWLNDQSIKWLVDYNFPDVKKYPKFWKQVEPPEDLEKLSKVHQVVLPWLDDVPKKFVHDTYSIPSLEGDEEPLIIKPASSIPFGFATGTVPNYRRSRASGRLGTVPLFSDSGQTKIDDIISKILKEGGISEFRVSLEKIINEAVSLEDLEAKIVEQYKNVDIDKMKEILSRAILIADLTGRASV
jgi:phage gp29-like protein